MPFERCPRGNRIPDLPIVTKSVAHLNHQAVAALRMQTLMKTEYVFGKAVSRRPAKKNLAFRSVGLVNFSVTAPLIDTKRILPQLLHVSSTDIHMGSLRWSHVGEVKEKCQTPIAVDIVMKALTRSPPFFATGRTRKTPPNTRFDRHWFRAKILASNGDQLRIGCQSLEKV